MAFFLWMKYGSYCSTSFTNSKEKMTTHSEPPSKKTFIYTRGSKIVTIESFVTFNSIMINHSVAWNGTTMPSYPSLTKPIGPSSCSI